MIRVDKSPPPPHYDRGGAECVWGSLCVWGGVAKPPFHLEMTARRFAALIMLFLYAFCGGISFNECFLSPSHGSTSSLPSFTSYGGDLSGDCDTQQRLVACRELSAAPTMLAHQEALDHEVFVATVSNSSTRMVHLRML